MRFFFIILFLLPLISFSQTKDYKTYDKASSYFQAGKLEKSKKLSLRLIQDNSDWDYPHLLLASIYEEQGEIDLSVNHLLNVYLKDNPNYTNGIEKIAKLFYNNGRYSKSIYYFEKLLEIDSTFLAKDISLSEFKNIYGNPVYKLSVDKILQNCNFAIKAIEEPVSFDSYNMGENINSSFAEYLPAISVNNKLFFITRRLEYEDGYSNEEFFISKRDNDGNWSGAFRLNAPINTSGNEGAISLSANGMLLVFTACERRNGYGDCDLYFSYKFEDWSNPVNIGENINSKKSDKQPSLSPDGKYLYFVSNRKGGYGGLDIWKTEITYTKNGKIRFMKPVNLGPTINTRYDEMSPFIHTDNLTLYFASNGHVGMGNYDLLLSRRVTSQSNWCNPINLGYPINTYRTENSLIVASDGNTAYYASDKSGFGKEDIFQFDLPKNLQAEPLVDLEMDIITNKAGEEVILKNVSFASNSYALEESSFAELNKLITYLQKNPNFQIEIQGHTDNVGNETDNQILSQQRAKVVFEYISAKVENKLTYKGFGESQPLGEDRMRNRRTSFVIID